MTTPSVDPYRAEIAARSAEGYVDWPAILAGTVFAVALSFVLLTFGSAVGLSIVSFEPREGASLAWLAIATGIWFLWVAITSFAAGGYLAGRLRRPVPGASIDEIELRDGAHGALVWATGTLFAAVLAASGITGVVGAAGSAAGTVAETAAQAVGGDVDYLASRLVQSGGQEPAPPPDQPQPAQPSAAQPPAGQQPPGQQAAQTQAAAPVAEPPTGGQQQAGQPQAGIDGGTVAMVINRGLADGELAPEDRTHLVRQVAAATGQSEEQAAAQVDAAFQEARSLYDQAVQTAERARVATAIAGFAIAATLLASAAAAYFAAAAGGDHRDRNLPFGTFH